MFKNKRRENKMSKNKVSSLELTKKQYRKEEFKWMLMAGLSAILILPTFGISIVLLIKSMKKFQTYNLLKKLYPNTISKIIISDVGSKGEYSRETEMYALHNQGEIVKLLEAKEVDTPITGQYYYQAKALQDTNQSRPLVVTQAEFNKLVGNVGFNLK